MLLQDPPKVSRIQLPPEVAQSMVMQDQYATVVDIGPLAWRDEPVPRCVVGDRVVFSKFAGFVVPGKDERLYRCVNDRDIFMAVEEEEDE
jgi:co-chaperonin GroES (HSP10)